ncbi:hypothetical protein HNY73_004457 [Argiope bruennichi]|uniref:Uncharacterized protein n=1 Tax=Argiope bruennichi TaxID=94029 RepID=A0A8T0FRW3_ARGBR|nr:hypothetical protein HNY73_004457 [Argiope bruennichi]
MPGWEIPEKAEQKGYPVDVPLQPIDLHLDRTPSPFGGREITFAYFHSTGNYGPLRCVPQRLIEAKNSMEKPPHSSVYRDIKKSNTRVFGSYLVRFNTKRFVSLIVCCL